MEELENAFSIDRVSKSGGVFDTEKLHWVNQHYIQKASSTTSAASTFASNASIKVGMCSKFKNSLHSSVNNVL